MGIGIFSTVALLGIAACGGGAVNEIQSSGPTTSAASPTSLVDPVSSLPVPDFTNVNLLPAESCSVSSVPTTPDSLPPGASFPAASSPTNATLATEGTALVAADNILPNTELSAPVNVRLESWQDVVNASAGTLTLGQLVSPQRCVWAVSVHQQNSGFSGPANVNQTYSDFDVVIDEATGYEVDQAAGIDLTGASN